MISKPPIRRLTTQLVLSAMSLFSKPPVRRLTSGDNHRSDGIISKPPMRRLTKANTYISKLNVSKPPMRRLTAIISPRNLMSCHLVPIILPFTFFLGNHKIPYYNYLHNLDIKNRVKFNKRLFLIENSYTPISPLE